MKSILFSTTYLIEVDDDMYSEETGELIKELDLKISQTLSENIEIKNNEKLINLEWISMKREELIGNHSNCGRCANCGQWTTDREEENPIDGLCNGARVNGTLLCDECLPPDHRWAF